jgi:hypothetical protein
MLILVETYLIYKKIGTITLLVRVNKRESEREKERKLVGWGKMKKNARKSGIL